MSLVSGTGSDNSVPLYEELGLPLSDEVRRQRLIDLLAERWNTSALVIEAAGGSGKSTAVAQAIHDNAIDPSGYDRYLQLRPTHRNPAHLGAAILALLGGNEESEGTPQDLADHVAEELAGFSPNAVCLHLDDVHTATDSADLIDFISELFRRLPQNGHLVLVGRSFPSGLFRELSDGQDVLRVDSSDLIFTETELAELAGNHGADPAALAAVGGWPAMTRLALAVGPGAPEEFLIEEVIQQLTVSERVALATTVLAGRSNAELMAAVGADVDVLELMAHVPLLESLDGEWIRAHDLWADVVDHVVDADRRADLVAVIVPWHSAGDRHDDAINLAADARLWDVARAAVMAAARHGDVSLDGETTRQWLALFPESQADQPEVLFLRGLAARLADADGIGNDHVARALDIFEERGDGQWAATAAIELCFQGWLAGDAGAVLDVIGRVPRLVVAGATQLENIARLGAGGVAEMKGDFLTALEESASVDTRQLPRGLAELTCRHVATMAFLVGDSARGVAEVKRLVEFDSSAPNRFILGIARYQHGDPGWILDSWQDSRYMTRGNQRDDFSMAAFSCAVDASLGIVPDVALVDGLAWGRSRERCFVAIVKAAADVIRGQRDAAATHLDALLADVGFDESLVEGELRRFLPYGYVLSAEVRSYFEDPKLSPPLGPSHLRTRAVARIVVALHSGDSVDWRGYAGPEATLCALPMPWSLEVACGLMEHDPAAGLDLADYLLSVGGSSAQRMLRRIAHDEAGRCMTGAEAVLRSLPAPPSTTTRLSVCGELVIEREGIARKPQRSRVRQVLALLVLRQTVHREEMVRLFWSDLPPDRARSNLSSTLTHLRRELEPDRRAAEPTYHIRERGQTLTLQRSSTLWIDVRELEDRMETAASLRGQGRRRLASEAEQEAIALWGGPAFQDLRHIVELEAEIQALDRRLLAVGIGHAEWMLSENRTVDARRLARRVLDHDPYSERAAGVIIAACLDDGDVAGAGRAIALGMQALSELEVVPSAATRMLVRRYEVRVGSGA